MTKHDWTEYKLIHAWHAVNEHLYSIARHEMVNAAKDGAPLESVCFDFMRECWMQFHILGKSKRNQIIDWLQSHFSNFVWSYFWDRF